MQPFYFGSSERPLFGVYHRPEGGSAKASAVLLCQPLGHEYLRAHRAFRNLAVALAGLGFHVLRFDYFGSGDSGGVGEDTTVDQCLEDIATAIEELKDMSGRTRVSLIGLRFGATLASLAAASRSDVDRVVLWDPVVDGKAYLDEVVTLHRRWRKDRLGDPGGPASALEVLGFPMTEAGVRRISETALLASAAKGAHAVSLLASEEHPSYGALHEVLKSAEKPPGVCCVVPGAGNWTREDLVHHTLLPHAMMKVISSVMSS